MLLNLLNVKILETLIEGTVADIAVLGLMKGKFGFIDAAGFKRLEGNHKLEAELTIRAGKIVWDLNGISAVKFVK